jgi:hypothetical protein
VNDFCANGKPGSEARNADDPLDENTTLKVDGAL